MAKKLKFINYIMINSEQILMSELSERDKTEIAEKLNDKAMLNLGYARTSEKQKFD